MIFTHIYRRKTVYGKVENLSLSSWGSSWEKAVLSYYVHKNNVVCLNLILSVSVLKLLQNSAHPIYPSFAQPRVEHYWYLLRFVYFHCSCSPSNIKFPLHSHRHRFRCVVFLSYTLEDQHIIYQWKRGEPEIFRTSVFTSIRINTAITTNFHTTVGANYLNGGFLYIT